MAAEPRRRRPSRPHDRHLPALPDRRRAAARLFDRLLLTGAAGGLGRELRPRLKRHCRVLRAQRHRGDGAGRRRRGSHRRRARGRRRGARAARRRRRDRAPRRRLGRGAVRADPAGQHRRRLHLYEAARKHGVARIVFASSNHVTGFYRQDEVIDPTMPMRPDGHYGLSKAFGENLSRFYFDRYGIETVCLRIGSSFPEPKDRRMLATWLSYDDLERLVVASLTAPVVGHSVIYGMSDNATTWWDNTAARAHRLSPAGQLRAVPRRRRGAPADARPQRPGRRVPGRRLRHQGPVRLNATPTAPGDPP